MGKRLGLFVSLVVGIGVVVAAAPGTAEAQTGSAGAKWTVSLTKDYTPSAWTSQMGWGNRAKAKLGFGLKNALLGWTELLMEPKQALDEGDNFFTGVWTGFVNATGDTTLGVVHTVTFFMTELDAPLPQGGTQLLNG